MKKAWAWLKRWGALILGILVTILTLGLVGRHVAKKLGKLRDEKQLAEATAEVKRLEAVRAEVHDRVGAEDAAVAILDNQIAEQKRRAVSAFVGGEGLSDEELEDAFREALGG